MFSKAGRNLESSSRSDVLKPLALFAGLFLTAMTVGAASGAATWMLVLLGTILAAGSILFGYSYVYCLHNDRDALRSESFNIDKMAIQHGVFGDSNAGIIPNAETVAVPLLSTDAPKDEQE